MPPRDLCFQVEWPGTFANLMESIKTYPLFNFDIFDSMLPIDCIFPSSSTISR